MPLIKPFLQNEALLADIDAGASRDGFRLWWLGQSGFLLQWQGHHLLFDPYLSDSLTEKYAATDKPHVRMTELVIEPEFLHFVEVVTSSHNHTDHLDADTLNPLRQANQFWQFVIPEANREFVASRLDCPQGWPIGLTDGESQQIGVWNFTGIAAAHNELEMDAAGRHKYLGFVVKFGPYSVYHSGDTLLYPGLVERLAPHGVDVALVPINGNRPERRVAGNLNGAEAAQLAKDIGAKVAIPHHYEGFTFNTASPEEFVAACERLGQAFCVLRAGERFEFGGAA